MSPESHEESWRPISKRREAELTSVSRCPSSKSRCPSRAGVFMGRVLNRVLIWVPLCWTRLRSDNTSCLSESAEADKTNVLTSASTVSDDVSDDVIDGRGDRVGIFESRNPAHAPSLEMPPRTRVNDCVNLSRDLSRDLSSVLVEIVEGEEVEGKVVSDWAPPFLKPRRCAAGAPKVTVS